MPFNVNIKDFEGPFDLLYHLVKETKMDIYEVDMHEIIESYLEIIKTAKDLNIEVASEFLVMASSLLHLKSKMLVGSTIESDSEEDITSEEDLKSRLIEYEQYKKVTNAFKELEEKRQEVYTRFPESLKEYQSEDYVNGGVTIEDLVDAFKKFQKRVEMIAPIETKITKKEISVSMRTQQIRKVLDKRGKVSFFSLFDVLCREYVVVTFLSVLEMSKNDEIFITQENNFEEIVIERR